MLVCSEKIFLPSICLCFFLIRCVKMLSILHAIKYQKCKKNQNVDAGIASEYPNFFKRKGSKILKLKFLQEKP